MRYDLGGILLLIGAWMKCFGPQFPLLYQYRQDLFSTDGKANGNQLFTMFANQFSVGEILGRLERGQ